MRERSWILILVLGLFLLESTIGSGTNIALKKKVIGHGEWIQNLVDGRPNHYARPRNGSIPMVAVDLEDVYKVTLINIHGSPEGINVPFSVYGWVNHTSPCDIEGLYPWTSIKKGLTFKSATDVVTVETQAEARYIILAIDFKDPYDSKPVLSYGELEVFGEKIRDGYKYTLPEDGTPLRNVIVETRQALLKGQRKIYAQVSYMGYIPDTMYQDVSLAWYKDRVNTMAVIREKARAVLMSGPKVIRKLVEDTNYAALRNNFRAWLSHGNANAKFVNVSQGYSDGDILLISRFDNFDVEKVAKSLKEGKNSAVISYILSKFPRENKVGNLLKKLNVTVQSMSEAFGTLDMDTTEFYNSRKDVPWDFDLRIALLSWKQFSTVNLPYAIPNERLLTEECQNLIREVLDKYHDLFTYLAPCASHPYKKNNITDIALANYNRVLLLQRQNSIRRAPGSFTSPGYVHQHVKPTAFTVEYMPDLRRVFVPTGGYAAPGVPVRYKVIQHSFENLNAYYVRISGQTDVLLHKDSFGRWPILTYEEPLSREGIISSPFGGPIFLTIPNNASLKIQFENAYRYGWYDIRNPKTDETWEEEKRKFRGVPYWVVHGDKMINTLDEKTLLKMDAASMHWSVTYYDNIIKTMLNYKGLDPTTERQEVMMLDDDISGGLAHAGLPWMTYRSVGDTFSQVDWLKKNGAFLVAHEVGHNMQRGEFTWRNGGEVTNNMFIPVVNTYCLGWDGYRKGIRPGNTDNDIQKMLNNWRNPTYVGVQESFYNYFSRWFSPALIGNVLPHMLKPPRVLDTDEKKIDFWLKKMCEESGYDLAPFHSLWHLPITKEAKDVCSKYPCWFPDDEYTQQIPDIVDKVLKQYGRTCERGRPKQVEFKIDPQRGHNQTKSQTIFIENL